MHRRTLEAARLLGPWHLAPGAPPSSGGFPTALLRALAANAEARLYILALLPEWLRELLCARALSLDVCRAGQLLGVCTKSWGSARAKLRLADLKGLLRRKCHGWPD